MNTETGKFENEGILRKEFERKGESFDAAVKEKKYVLFALGEEIEIKGQFFLVQAITDDCLILIPKVKADFLNRHQKP